MENSGPKFIVGAGLAGLLAAVAWPRATILEAAPGPNPAHRALLRFRSDAVARLTGIEFRKVTVRKAIYHQGEEVAPTIALANQYSQKCLGALLPDRSVWNLAPVERYIAPESLYEQLIEMAGSRIVWSRPVASFDHYGPYISTMPLPIALGISEMFQRVGDSPESLPEFARAAITVARYRIMGAGDVDLYQTVYFPAIGLRMYRASITGSLLILEFAGDDPFDDGEQLAALRMAIAAFGLTEDRPIVPQGDSAHQSFGKIVPIPDGWRKHAIFRLSQEHGVYSLGRFGVWKNILLDDVVSDIDVIKRLMRSGPYEHRRSLS